MAGTATVGILRVLLTANSAEFETALKRASASAAATSKDLGAMGRQATALGLSLTKTLTVPILGLGVGAAKMAMDFESSFAGVRKTVDATEPEFAQMAQAFRDLSKQIPVNVNELNRLGEAAGALGIPKAAIVDFAKVMAQLGVTTNLTSEQAATSIAKIQTVFQAAGKDTDRFAAALVDLGNKGASTEQEILMLAQRIASAGNAVGMSQAQVLGFAAAIANVGIEAEAGGSAISKVFSDISIAVSNGGDAVAGFAQTAGVSVEAFSKLFKEDASAAVVQFIEGLGKVKQQGGDLNITLQELGFTEIRQARALRDLALSGDNLSKSLAIANQGWKDNTALTEEARKRFATTEAQLTLLWTRVKDVGITLGNALLPTINLTIQAFNQLIPVIDVLARGFNAMPVGIQATVIGLGLVVAAIGPVIFVMGQLLIAASAVTGAFTAKGIGARALGVALTALSAPVIAIGSLIGGLAVIWANFKDDWVRAFDILIPPLGIFRSGLDAVKRAMEPHLPLIRDLSSIVNSLFVIAWENAKGVLLSLKDAVLVPLRTEWNLWKLAIGEVASSLTSLLMPALRPLIGPMLLLVDINQRLGKESEAAKLAIRLLAGDLKSAADAHKGSAVAAKQNADAIRMMASHGATVPPVFKAATTSAVELTKGVKDTATATRELRTAQQELLPVFRDLNAVWSLGTWTTFAPVLSDAAAKFDILAATMPPLTSNTAIAMRGLEALKAAAERAGVTLVESREKTESWREGLGTLAQALSQLAQVSGESFSEVARWLATVVTAMDVANKSAVQFSKGLDTFKGGERAAGFVQMASGALALVAALHQATAATNKFQGALAGVMAMAGTGNPWLMLAGGIYGYIRGLNNAQEAQRLLGVQFRKDLGALRAEAQNVMQQAWVLGLDDDLQEMLRTAETQADLERIAELIGIIQTNYGQLKDEAGGLFDELMTLAEDAGGIPDSMREVVEHFRMLGLLTDEQEEKLRLLGDSGVVSLDKMKAAAEVIGARFESLGPKFNQERLNTDVMKVVNALDTLIKGGADVGGVLFDARDEISELVRESLKFKTTVPANMKPWIDHLFETGNLLDENGEKITDISQIKYGEPLKTEAEKITEAFKTMTQKLLDFFDRLGQEILRIPDRRIKVGVDYDDSELPPNLRGGGGGGDDEESGTMRPQSGAFSAIGPAFDPFTGLGLPTIPAGALSAVGASLRVPSVSTFSVPDTSRQASAMTAAGTDDRRMAAMLLDLWRQQSEVLTINLRDAVRGAV